MSSLIKTDPNHFSTDSPTAIKRSRGQLYPPPPSHRGNIAKESLEHGTANLTRELRRVKARCVDERKNRRKKSIPVQVGSLGPYFLAQGFSNQCFTVASPQICSTKRKELIHFSSVYFSCSLASLYTSLTPLCSSVP